MKDNFLLESVGWNSRCTVWWTFQQSMIEAYVSFLNVLLSTQKPHGSSRMYSPLEKLFYVLIIIAFNMLISSDEAERCVEKRYSKNPYPLRKCIIPNTATARVPGMTGPVASWFLGPNGCLIRNYVISQWVWVFAFIPWPMGMRVNGCWRSCISQHHFSPSVLTLVMG